MIHLRLVHDVPYLQFPDADRVGVMMRLALEHALCALDNFAPLNGRRRALQQERARFRRPDHLGIQVLLPQEMRGPSCIQISPVATQSPEDCRGSPSAPVLVGNPDPILSGLARKFVGGQAPLSC